MSYNYLDKDLINKFRNAINSSPIFYSEEEYKNNWNFMCAMMDRVDSCVNYINNFDIKKFDSEESLISFLTYCCMLNDCIIQLFSSISKLNDFYKANIKEQSKFFKDDYKRFINKYDNTSNIVVCSDDKFFEFLRSITFAHPLETNRANFIKKNDKLCSPFVLVNSLFEDKIKNPIGVAIYSKIDDKTIHLWLSANHIVEYLKYKYCLFKKATNWLNNEISIHNIKWKERKVNRSLSPIDLLKDIKAILKERYADLYFIDETIDILECQITDSFNNTKVNQYRKALIKTLPQLCDWIDSLQNEDLYPDNYFRLLDPRPEIMYPQAHYELSKIFSYLNDDVINYTTYVQNRNIFIRTNDSIDVSNFEWGLIQAELFFNSLGNQYLNFDISKINSSIEVKLLVRTALFLEITKQNKGHVSRCIKKLIRESINRTNKLKIVDTIKMKSNNGDDIVISVVDASDDKKE